MTHLKKVELVGKPNVVQADKAGARISNANTLAAQLNLNLRASAPHAARARALNVTRAHMTGIAMMLRYLSNKNDHALSTRMLATRMLATRMLGSGGLLGRNAS